MQFFPVLCQHPALSWRTSVQQLVTGILLAFELCHEPWLQRVSVCMQERERERVWMRACVYVPASCPHTPSSLVLQQADCCLGNTTSSCLLKVGKNAALFIYLSNFFSSFLSEGWAYAPLSSGGRDWNDFRCDKIRTRLIFFFSLHFANSTTAPIQDLHFISI